MASSLDATSSDNMIEGTTGNNNEITEEETGQLNTHERELMGSIGGAQRPLISPPPPPPPPQTTLMASSSTTSCNIEITEDHVPVFVAYNGKWEYDGKEWFFKNFKFSMIVVPKHITLSELIDILHKQLEVDKVFYRIKLEVHYRTGCPWFPVIEIQNDHDLSVFISETSKTKLPLCVSLRFNFLAYDVAEERRKGDVRVLVAYNGKWRWDGEKWLFENSKGSIMDVSKYVTLSEITGMLYEEFEVDQDSYDLKLEVHYRGGSPWFPVTEIQNNQDLSLFISESWKTKLALCVTRVTKDVVIEGAEHGRKDDRAEKRLINAIRKDDWVKAREIINTEEVTWTSKLDEDGHTAFHFAVTRYKDNEVVKEIVMGINSEELLTIVDNRMLNPAHAAALYGNTEALKIMLASKPNCLFNADDDVGLLPIHYALHGTEIETFLYLFKEMKSYKVEYDELFRDKGGFLLLNLVIDKGLIDVAYELINDYPSLATMVSRDNTALKCIIEKPELFYSGTHYNLFERFVYSLVPIDNKSLGSTNTADVEKQETPKKDKFVTKHRRRCLHDVFLTICFKLWETTVLHGKHKLPPN